MRVCKKGIDNGEKEEKKFFSFFFFFRLNLRSQVFLFFLPHLFTTLLSPPLFSKMALVLSRSVATRAVSSGKVRTRSAPVEKSGGVAPPPRGSRVEGGGGVESKIHVFSFFFFFF